MAEYNPKVIHEYAERLNKQSRTAVPMNFFIGLFSGVIIFGGISAVMMVGFDFVILSIGALIGGALGYGAGQQRASELKLQAQMSLCQAKIEENTRR